MGNYVLKCPECGQVTEDPHAAMCPVCREKSLLQTVYEKKQIDVTEDPGVFMFRDWLPVRSQIPTRACPVVFRSENFAKELGLKDVLFGFTGYYPERNAFAVSGTFEELSALTVLAGLQDARGSSSSVMKPLVVASAGNAGRAFAELSELGLPVVIIVPETALPAVRVTNSGKNVRLITVKGDYADAAAVAERFSSAAGAVPEGGGRNVAHRDGAGTVFLRGTLTAGRIPDIYIQAAGSGAGCIAAREAALRLIGDGRFGDRLPEIHAVQNEPFTPLKSAWENDHETILPEDMNDAENMIRMTYAQALTDRLPFYAQSGGFRDSLRECGGKVHSVTEKEAKIAMSLWQFYENCDLDPAAAAALAALIKGIEDGSIDPEKKIFLNLTGGGYDRIKEDFSLRYIRPEASVLPDYDFNDDPEGLLK